MGGMADIKVERRLMVAGRQLLRGVGRSSGSTLSEVRARLHVLAWIITIFRASNRVAQTLMVRQRLVAGKVDIASQVTRQSEGEWSRIKGAIYETVVPASVINLGRIEASRVSMRLFHTHARDHSSESR
jgi:hypothetical protein